MFPRKLPRPETSLFLLGPRGTGKSTWIHQTFPDAIRYDLLDSGEALRLSKEPQRLYQELDSQPAGTWVVLDEVQKVPALLNEVHRLIEPRGLQFVLCGSSARKLRRGGVNLLAGRAISAEMYPFVSAEVNYQINFERVCRFGMLPLAYGAPDPQSYLRS